MQFPPLETFAGVGPATGQKLMRLNIHTAMDALLHLPVRYEDRTRVTALKDVQPAATVLIEGRIIHVREPSRGAGRRGQTQVALAPLTAQLEHVFAHGNVSLVFFHSTAAQLSQLQPGSVVRAWGDVRMGHNGLELVHPEYSVRNHAANLPPLPAALTPIYASTDGLTQARLRMVIAQALQLLVQAASDDIDLLLASQSPQLPSFAEAMRILHTPPTDVDVLALVNGTHCARQRLAMEELLIQQALLLQARATARSASAPACAAVRDSSSLFTALRSALPFPLTNAQTRVCAEIDADLAGASPMLRLLQGDVGSGKTAVAALASARAVENGQQVALMVPTEVLATQHLATFEQWFAPLGVRCEMFVGRQGRKQRTALADGTINIAIGTQALIQNGVEFAQLGLVIIDEQHRFGVRQRLMLNAKSRVDGLAPHQLVLTATPIPRTLAQTAYADLDLSIIDERPRGRKPIQTISLPHTRREEVIARVAANLRSGAQAYWVCPLIENSEHISAAAAEESVAMLRAALPDLEIGLMHGRLSSAEKALAMARFKAGESQLLVATTVIEVGVDVPNANLMVIENSERLGLAQLHQLRGRVGRGDRPSHCVLLYQSPLAAHARARLAALRVSNDGFRLAEQDLALRGPGEILGTRQTGDIHLRAADLIRDAQLLPGVQRIAAALVRDSDGAHAEVIAALAARWLPAAAHLIGV